MRNPIISGNQKPECGILANPKAVTQQVPNNVLLWVFGTWHSIKHMVRTNQCFLFWVLSYNVSSLHCSPEWVGVAEENAPLYQKGVLQGYPGACYHLCRCWFLYSELPLSRHFQPEIQGILKTVLGPKKLWVFKCWILKRRKKGTSFVCINYNEFAYPWFCAIRKRKLWRITFSSSFTQSKTISFSKYPLGRYILSSIKTNCILY